MGREVGVLRAGRLVQTATPADALPDAGRPRRRPLRRRGGRAARAAPPAGRSSARSAGFPSTDPARGRHRAGDDPARADPAARARGARRTRGRGRRPRLPRAGHGRPARPATTAPDTVILAQDVRPRRPRGRRRGRADRRRPGRGVPVAAELAVARPRPAEVRTASSAALVALGASAAAVLRSPAAAAAERQRRRHRSIVLYNGQHLELTQALVAAFEKQSGIDVRMRTNDSIVLAEPDPAGGARSPADVYLSENSPELMTLEEHGLLAQARARRRSRRSPRAVSSPTGDWVGMALRVSSLVYNPSRARLDAAPGLDPRPREAASGRARSRSRRPTPTSRRSSAR